MGGWKVSVTYIIPIAYLILMLVIGFVLSKKQQSRSDFYVAANQMNSSVLFATIFSTVVGANTYMGFSGEVYSLGFSHTWLLVAAGSAYFVLFFISGKIRHIAKHHEVFTLPDMMEVRYSKSVAIWTTIFSFVGLIGGAGGSILGIGVILNSTLGIDTNLAILITAVVTIVYTTFGGLMGVAWTDWAQSLIMVIGLILIVVFGIILTGPNLSAAGSLTHFTDSLTDHLGTNSLSFIEGVTFFLVMGWWLTFLPLNTISQTSIQRVYSAKSEKVIKRISLLMVIFVGLFMSFALSLVGMMGQVFLPGLNNPEAVFPMLALEVINPWIGMIIITGILGAAMSTVDSNLLGASIHISRDVYERYKNGRNEKISEKQAIKLSRWAIVTIGVISTIAAMMTPSIMDLLVGTMQIFAGATFIPIIAGLYWKQANSKGALAGIILGGTTTIAALVSGSEYAVIFGSIVSLVSLVAVSLFTKEERKVSHVFSYKSITNKDYIALAFAVLFFVLFLFGLTNLSLWPILIILTLLGMTFALVMMVVFVIPKKENKG